VRFESAEITVVRAGMLMPAARVSVANTTLMRPCWKSSSISSFQAGSTPAWWAAMPRNKGSAWPSRTASGVAATKASSRTRMRACSAGLTRHTLPKSRTDLSQPRRLKMK
jgi:hypothetical protein